MIVRNKKYILHNRCGKIASGVLKNARQRKMTSMVKVFLCLKQFNTNGRLTKGEITKFITSPVCVKNFSSATFWNCLKQLVNCGLVIDENSHYIIKSNDDLSRFFGVDPIKSKKISIRHVHFVTGNVLNAIDTAEITFNKAKQRKAIVAKVIDNDRKIYGTACGDAINYKQYYAKTMSNSVKRVNSQTGVPVGEPVRDIAMESVIGDSTVEINLDVNCSLAKYCQILGISTRTLASRKIRELKSNGFVNVSQRSLWEENTSLPAPASSKEYDFVCYRITRQCLDVRTLTF